jgi:hypothetical protein
MDDISEFEINKKNHNFNQTYIGYGSERSHPKSY